ncbi:MAG: threonine-phosphate decarboxylase CobD [Pseudomonadota bacterium]
MNDDLRHGGALDAMREAFPAAPTPWLDLSTGINPFTYPDTATRSSSATDLPGRALISRCSQAMAAAFGAPQRGLLLAPGSELLIRLLPTILAPRSVAVLSPSYGDHAQLWRAAGCRVIEDADPLAFAEDVDAVVLCNPNNPDGRCFSAADLHAARSALAKRGAWLIVDEAYADLDPALSVAQAAGEAGLLILRSFGKFYGLAGVRLGALLGPSSALEAMSERLGAWPVSGVALELGARAYADLGWQRDTRARLAKSRERLTAILTENGLDAGRGTNLFAYARAADANELWQRLGKEGVYVRRFSWSTTHVRIGLPPDRAAEERLARALRR